jgi:polar amino acid transport system ATP-binding protein/sulfate transport system ATP-binding protein/NitT/TauT family transport system ATP-binding protein
MPYEIAETLLKAENLSKTYGNKLVIRDVSFEIKNVTRPGLTQGQILSLIGASGVGKSTIFRMLAGLETPTSGQIKVCMGQGQELKPVREGDMGVVFQNYIMFDDLTIRENFKVALKYRPNAKNIDAKAFIDAYSTEFNLSQHLDKYPCQLSGGQRQRAAIIVQLLNGSPFLLLDEPLSGLDVLMIDKITSLLVKISLADEYQTIIIVSHDLENCLAISDTAFIIGLEAGKEGAILKGTIDLMQRDLAWHPDIKDLPRFRDTLKEVKAML